MGRKVIRTASDGTTTTFASVTAAAVATEKVAKTSLLRLLNLGKSESLGGYTWKYEERIFQGVAPTTSGPTVQPSPVPVADAPPSQEEILTESPSQEAALNLFASLRTDDGRVITEMRMDGYVNATKMCHSAQKLWGNYYRSATTQEYLDALEKSIHIRTDLLVQTIGDGPNAGRGTWVHRKVAIHLAQWCSPYFAVQVADLVDRYVSGRVTTEESQAAANIARRAVEDAEIESRKRKLQMDEEEHAKKMKMREEEMALRKRERDDEIATKERELELRDRDPAYKVDFYVTTFRNLGLELEGTDRILLKDMIRNSVAPLGGRGANPETTRVLLPVSDMYRKITGQAGNRHIWMTIGKYAASLYRSMHGKDPDKTERVIDGASRMVAAYEGSDAAWMRPLIEAYTAGELDGVKYGNVRFENGRVVY